MSHAVKLSSTDNEQYQMVPIPPGLLKYRVKKETIIELCAEIKNLKKTKKCGAKKRLKNKKLKYFLQKKLNV